MVEAHEVQIPYRENIGYAILPQKNALGFGKEYGVVLVHLSKVSATRLADTLGCTYGMTLRYLCCKILNLYNPRTPQTLVWFLLDISPIIKY
jgi:hypothetical protein